MFVGKEEIAASIIGGKSLEEGFIVAGAAGNYVDAHRCSEAFLYLGNKGGDTRVVEFAVGEKIYDLRAVIAGAADGEGGFEGFDNPLPGGGVGADIGQLNLIDEIKGPFALVEIGTAE